MAIHESFNEGGFLGFLDDLEFDKNMTEQLMGSDDFVSSPASLSEFSESQLCIPDDPIEDLEWFPNFTNEPISLSGIQTSPDHEIFSFSGFPKTPEQETEESNERVVGPRKGFEGLLRRVITSKKPRTKRVGGRRWGSMKSPSPEKTIGVVLGRRCTHCQVDKTPQWRTGPLGPKTLCNACGVRFKSGRLVPEYRPAASPSFNVEVHSNSHKKIMKMREVKDW
ncbi:GATA transcription factor 4-like [Macadamia integrifolia]|uniref:GATA transcription factor 4-like n=1 Tax=Macadamia integrifolia TaxID=60698 RepID=UPI001C4F3180|nr:GATA transcription factor 4-like [Macadamia integrifolia]